MIFQKKYSSFSVVGDDSRSWMVTVGPNEGGSWENLEKIFNTYTTSDYAFYSVGGVPISEDNPHIFYINFEKYRRVCLKQWRWRAYSNYAVPKNGKIFGSETGEFNGEEVELTSFEDVSSAGRGVYTTYEIPDHKQSYHYIKIVVTEYAGDYFSREIRCDSFAFSTHDYYEPFDTVADYIRPEQKIGKDTFYVERNITKDYHHRFCSLMCMFVEDFGFDVDVISYPSKIVLHTNGANRDEPWAHVVIRFDINSTYKAIIDGIWSEWDYEKKEGLGLRLYQSSDDDYKYWYLDDSNPKIQAFGNRGFFWGYNMARADYDQNRGMMLFGHLPVDDLYRKKSAQLTRQAPALTNDILHVDSTAIFEIGEYYGIYGMNGEGRDYGIQVLDIIDANRIKVDNLPRDYSEGAKIGKYPQSFYCLNTGIYNFGFPRSGKEAASSYDKFVFTSLSETLLGSGSLFSKKTILPVFVVDRSTMVGLLNKNMGISEKRDPGTVLSVGEKTPRDNGFVSVAGTHTLTDDSKTWAEDELKGRIVYISEGDAYSQSGVFGEIVSNTSDTLEISYPWAEPLGVGDRYHIADEMWLKTGFNYQLISADM